MRACTQRRSRVFSLASVIVVAVAVSVPSAGSAATGKSLQRFFFAPGVTTSCELDLNMKGIGTDAFCQTTGAHLQSARLTPDGRVKVCKGVTCVGDPPEGVPTLVYGSWLGLGPFRCTSRRSGVTCIVVKTGRGFLITPSAITLVSR